MKARDIGLLIRELAASFVIAILFPALVYYGLHVFVVTPSNLVEASTYLIAGVAAITIGLLVRVPALGTGLILGGGAAVVRAYVTRWAYLSNVIIFLSIVVAVGLLSLALAKYLQQQAKMEKTQEIAYTIRICAVSFVIAVLLPLVVYRGLPVFYPQPKKVQDAQQTLWDHDKEAAIFKGYPPLEKKEEWTEDQKSEVKLKLEVFNKEKERANEVTRNWREHYQHVQFFAYFIFGSLMIGIGCLVIVPALGASYVFGGCACLLFAFALRTEFGHALNFIFLLGVVLFLMTALWWCAKRMQKEQKIFRFLRDLIAGLTLAFLLPSMVHEGFMIAYREPKNVREAKERIEQIQEEQNKLLSKFFAWDPFNEKISEEEKAQIKVVTDKFDAEESLLRNIVNDWNKHHRKIEFFVLLFVGIVLLGIGALIHLPFLGAALILGGGFAITRGYWSYWDQLSNVIIFLSLLAAIGLIAFALWRYAKKD